MRSPRARTTVIVGAAALLVVLAAACRPDVGPVGAQPSDAASTVPEPVHTHPTPPTPATSSAPPSHDPGHGSGLPFDAHKIPPGVPGSPVDRVARTGEMPTPSGDGVSAFRTVCQYSHMSTDDPIVYPGQPGAAHLHVFWGNSGVSAASTAGSIANTGNGTCRGGTINRTGYWAPAVIDTKTGTPIAPDLIHVYYKSGYLGVRPEQVRPMPAGLRMVAGNAKATGPQDNVGWKCWNAGGASKPTIPHCAAGDFVTMTVEFPQCWNGKDLDSPDHKSHMAYATPGRGCPAGYPVPLPVITFNILYPAADSSTWRLSSDVYPSSQPAGYSAHGDWFNGWRQDIEQTWIKGCVNRPVTCGSHMLGDGRVMEGDR
jgi:hypothetical protein